MIVITDAPNHPSIVSHRKPGYLFLMDNSIVKFDELLYFDDNAEWPDEEAPFYYYWNKEENFRCGVSVSNVKYIYFKDDRISQASI
jgi:hypothetical protein